MINNELEQLARSLKILDARKTLTQNPQVYDVPTTDIAERVTNALTTLDNDELVDQLIYALEKPAPNPLVVDTLKVELKKRLRSVEEMPKEANEEYRVFRTNNGWGFVPKDTSEEEEE